MKHNLWCSHCKTKENLRKNYLNKKLLIQHYLCLDCNAERARKYRKTPNGAARVIQAIRASEARYPGKQEARQKVHAAVLSGKIRKPKKCAITDCTGTKLHAHHPSHKNWQFILWLCIPHHRRFHEKLA